VSILDSAATAATTIRRSRRWRSLALARLLQRLPQQSQYSSWQSDVALEGAVEQEGAMTDYSIGAT
jgi:hypothetical protein